MLKDHNISVVAVLHNDAANIDEYIETISSVLKSHYRYYEIVLVDDASDDATVEAVERLQKRYKNIQLYCLPRARGEQIALNVGLENAIGDFVITMDIFYDPPELIPELLDNALANKTETVYAIPKDRETGRGLYDRLSRLFFTMLMKFTDVDIPIAVSSYRLFSRSVLNYILEVSDRHRTLAIAPALSGYNYGITRYHRRSHPEAKKRRSSARGIIHALDLIVSTSTFPLRMVTVLSLAISLFSVFYGVVVVIIRFFKEEVASGWASLSLEMAGLFFLVFFILSIMSEYLIRITEATNKRPLFHISKESFSSAASAKELNVEVENRSASRSKGTTESLDDDTRQ